MQPEISLAVDARQVLDNKAFKQAFTRMADHLERKALGCDVDNKEQTQRVILAKQILAGLQRELELMIESGQVAEIQLNEIEKRRKSVFRR